MNYIVMEFQTTDADATSVITTVHSTRSEAEQKYHLVLSAAAVSGLKYHGALIMDAFGEVLKVEHYPEIQPATEPV